MSDIVPDSEPERRRQEKAFLEALANGQDPNDGYVFTDEAALVQKVNSLIAGVKVGAQVRYWDKSQPGVETLTEQSAKSLLAPYRLEVLDGNKLKSLSGFNVWLKSSRREFFDRIVFRPDGKAGPRELNSYRGPAVIGQKGDWSLLNSHLYDNICAGVFEHWYWVMNWAAHLLQFPGERPGTALVVIGLKGTGKTKLFEWLGKAVGEDYTKVIHSLRLLAGNFNSHFANALLVVSEEGFWGGNKSAEGTVKHLVTGHQLALEAKGHDVRMVPIYFRLAITSNEKWVVPATADERRWAVFTAGDARRGDKAFFAALENQMKNGGLEAMVYDLMNWPVDHELVRTAPRTQGLADQILTGLNPAMRWLQTVLLYGYFPDRDGIAIGQAIWPEAGPLTVDRSVVRQSYQEFVRNYEGGAVSEGEIGRFLAEAVPGLETVRPRRDDKRVYQYQFPSLAEMQADFAKLTGEHFNVPIPSDADAASAAALESLVREFALAAQSGEDDDAYREARFERYLRFQEWLEEVRAAFQGLSGDFLAFVADATGHPLPEDRPDAHAEWVWLQQAYAATLGPEGF